MHFPVVWAVVAAVMAKPSMPLGACANADRALREIQPSDAYRADDPVGAGLARVREQISPTCRQALEAGQWPQLAQLFTKLLETGARYRTQACLLAPPELLPAVATWVKAGSRSQTEYIECAALLFRARRAEFDATVSPLFRADPYLAREIAVRVAPEDRSFLIPILDSATHDRAPGRDELFRLACAAESARDALPCRAPPELEPTWERANRRRILAVDVAPHVIVAVIYAAFVLVAGRRRQGEALRVAGVLGSAATAAAFAWFVAASPTPGSGALNAFNTLLGLVTAPLAAVIGGVVGWAALRAKMPPRVWCLANAVLYPAFIGAYFARS